MFKAAMAVLFAVVAIAVAFICYCSWRDRVIAQYRAELREKGFPEGYASRLAKLKWKHPNWKFLPAFVDDIEWSNVVDRECRPAVNLVINSSWAPGSWKSLGVDNYKPYYAKDAKAYDSGAWYQASRQAVEYFLDPRNFLNANDIFMFEMLDFDAKSQTRQAVEKTLTGSFMANGCYDGGDQRFSDLIYETGERLGVSPVFIAGRLTSEQGMGSPQAFGRIGDALVGYFTNTSGRVGNAVIWGRRFGQTSAATSNAVAKGASFYNGHYNFFNFRACGSGLFEIMYSAWAESCSDETAKKYLGPWITQKRAIAGGAIKVQERYIANCRHTRYLQKFSVLAQAGAFRWQQYMQNIGAPLSESRNTARAYKSARTFDSPYRFLIPVYRSMPSSPCPDPANGRSVYSPS